MQHCTRNKTLLHNRCCGPDLTALRAVVLQGVTGRGAASIGRRPAPFLAALRTAFMDTPKDI
jgi:hypothetical protein